MSISKKLKAHRNAAKLSVAEQAKKFGVSAQSLTNWESGITTPSVSNIAKINTATDLNLDAPKRRRAMATRTIKPKDAAPAAAPKKSPEQLLDLLLAAEKVDRKLAIALLEAA